MFLSVVKAAFTRTEFWRFGVSAHKLFSATPASKFLFGSGFPPIAMCFVVSLMPRFSFLAAMPYRSHGLRELSGIEQFPLGSIDPGLLASEKDNRLVKTNFQDIKSERGFAVFVPGILEMGAVMSIPVKFFSVFSPSFVDVPGIADVAAARFDVGDGVDA